MFETVTIETIVAILDDLSDELPETIQELQTCWGNGDASGWWEAIKDLKATAKVLGVVTTTLADITRKQGEDA